MSDERGMHFEMQSDALVWLDLAGADRAIQSPVKLRMSDAARLYRVLGDALRAFSAHSSEVLAVLAEEAELS